jgi:hypothetical protein
VVKGKTMPNTNNEYVTINFERTDGVYTLVDAIVLTKDEHINMTQEQLEAMQQKRWDDWYAIVSVQNEEVTVDGN